MPNNRVELDSLTELKNIIMLNDAAELIVDQISFYKLWNRVPPSCRGKDTVDFDFVVQDGATGDEAFWHCIVRRGSSRVDHVSKNRVDVTDGTIRVVPYKNESEG